ncbi:tryptophan synthase subunit alpha [Flavilitoribacter nigricans]|uniref:Tryptophan synthase alpha chain n=1 Tax=Flavilitoribacter nigricans (strain ATCC 23147 / DSM 23189 / NBRC 102662 / NCIMB 1420 / SS-2) TaxID=1122177 RepID=A0A2D0NJG4_FLAN2|nr:tryptophan synthase subunit alpha [Flavilitoribacter nigricans]PHN08506.1 tryptophan synthase subunit alpha [Flavilitoribacter nigricans DSM 23189 = NBRC 102662]
MNRLDQLFAEKQSNLLNIYFTAGYPALEDTTTIIAALAKAGVDLIEIGMPYSDPMADGPTIQESGMQALKNGMTLETLFGQVADVRAQTDVPLVLMGYFNQVMQYGEQAFVDRCVAVGIDGVILPDLPIFEYETFYRQMFEDAGLHVSFLITPQTSEDRIRKIDDLTRGFIYMVSDSSITGAKSGISDRQLAYFNRINAMQLEHPRLIGFGISNHETYAIACRYAQGAIIGSAFIKALAETTDLEGTIAEFVQMVRGEVAV